MQAREKREATAAGWCSSLGGLTPGSLFLQGAALLQSRSLSSAVHIWSPLHIWKNLTTVPLQVRLHLETSAFVTAQEL